jgi:hypothetical protein
MNNRVGAIVYVRLGIYPMDFTGHKGRHSDQSPELLRSRSSRCPSGYIPRETGVFIASHKHKCRARSLAFLPGRRRRKFHCGMMLSGDTVSFDGYSGAKNKNLCRGIGDDAFEFEAESLTPRVFRARLFYLL